MVDKALHEAGGWRYLVQQAKENPTAFLALVARRLPKEIKAEISAEMTIRQETRRELIERSVALMLAIERGGRIAGAIEATNAGFSGEAIEGSEKGGAQASVHSSAVALPAVIT